MKRLFLILVVIALGLSGCAYRSTTERVRLDEQGRTVEVIEHKATIIVDWLPTQGVYQKPKRFETGSPQTLAVVVE